MAALDSLSSNILPGERVAPTDAPLSSPSDYIKVPGTKKGSSAVLDINSSDQVLQRMQDFIDQRKGDQSVLGGIGKALSAASMSLYHPEAYVQMQKQEEEKQKDIFDSQMEMAQYKAAIANQKAYQDRVKALMGGTASGTDEVVGGGGAAGKRFSFNQLPPEIQASALAQPDSASFQKVIDDWAKEHAKQTYAATSGFEYSAPGQKQELYTFNTPQGVKQVDLTPFQAKQAIAEGKLPDGTPILPSGPGGVQQVAPAAPTPSGGITPGNIARVESNNTPFAVGPNVPGQGTAKSAMQVMDATSLNPGFGVAPAQLTGDPVHDEAERTRVGTEYFTALKGKYGDTLGALAYNWGPGNLDNWLASGAQISKLPPEAKDYVAKAHIASALEGNPAVKTAPSVTAPTQQAGVQGPNEQRVSAHWAANPPQTSSQFKQRDEQIKEARNTDAELQKQTHAAEVKSTEQERTAAGKYISKLETEGARAKEVANQADSIIKHATQHPNEFGWAKQASVLSPILNLPKVIPHYGKDISHGMEELIQPFAGKDTAARRDYTDSQAAKLGFDFAAQTFAGTGARLGVGLEQMAAKAKGLGTEHSATTNILNAKLIKVAYDKAADQAEAWHQYKTAHADADPNAFLQSPQNKAIEQKWNLELDKLEDPLRKTYPQFFNNQTINAQDKRPPLSTFRKKGQ